MISPLKLGAMECKFGFLDLLFHHLDYIRKMLKICVEGLDFCVACGIDILNYLLFGRNSLKIRLPESGHLVERSSCH